MTTHCIATRLGSSGSIGALCFEPRPFAFREPCFEAASPGSRTSAAKPTQTCTSTTVELCTVQTDSYSQITAANVASACIHGRGDVGSEAQKFTLRYLSSALTLGCSSLTPAVGSRCSCFEPHGPGRSARSTATAASPLASSVCHHCGPLLPPLLAAGALTYSLDGCRARRISAYNFCRQHSSASSSM